MDSAKKIEVPAPTAWPFVLAFGLTLVCAGMVTAAPLSILGAALALSGAVGWFRQVLPAESHDWVTAGEPEPVTERAQERVDRAIGPVPRAWLPIEIYPVSAGIKGGIAGSAAMAALAMLFGVVSGNGVWYAMNLLVAGFFPRMATESALQIGTFNMNRFLLAVPIHLLVSLLVGLLYGVMLPMLPRRPVLLGGVIAPLLWSGLIYGGLDVINPVMNRRIDWLWFALSQVGFGIVAGLVVSAQGRIPTDRNVPLLIRMGVEASGIPRRQEEDERR